VKVIRWLRDALIVVGLLGGMVAVGTPRSAFIVMFSILGGAFLLYVVFPLFLDPWAAPSPAASFGLRGEADRDVGLRGCLGVGFHRRPHRVERVLRRPGSPCLRRRRARIRGADRARLVGRGASSSTSPISKTTRAGRKASRRLRTVRWCRSHRQGDRLAARTPGSKATEASKAAPAPALNCGFLTHDQPLVLVVEDMPGSATSAAG
jgi:hypothetical protein